MFFYIGGCLCVRWNCDSCSSFLSTLYGYLNFLGCSLRLLGFREGESFMHSTNTGETMQFTEYLAMLKINMVSYLKPMVKQMRRCWGSKFVNVIREICVLSPFHGVYCAAGTLSIRNSTLWTFPLALSNWNVCLMFPQAIRSFWLQEWWPSNREGTEALDFGIRDWKIDSLKKKKKNRRTGW